MSDLVAHPFAALFPVLATEELNALAVSIGENGLRQPIVLARDGSILDGRNRAAACALIGIDPETVVYDGDDLAAYVIDANVTRRNMSTGARAMATALVLQADGRRDGGRWKRGTVANGEFSISETDTGWVKAMNCAGIVLDYALDLASSVVDGTLALDSAFQRADKLRHSAEHSKIKERERKRREKKEAQAEAKWHADIVATLTLAGSKYVALIESSDLTPTQAWAAYQEDTRKQREADAAIDDGYRRTCTRIAEVVRYLEGGETEALIFLSHAYPHEARFLADGMRLNRERIDAAIAFLTTIKKEVTL